MEQVIRNMNFRPLLEEVEFERFAPPVQNATINMRTWDEIKVERLRNDAVKVILDRNIKPEPECLFSLEVRMSLEVIINPSAFDRLDDPEEYFKQTQVMQVLCSHVATIVASLTTHSAIGPMITAPVPMMPK